MARRCLTIGLLMPIFIGFGTPLRAGSGTFSDTIVPILTTDGLWSSSPFIWGCTAGFCHGAPGFQAGLDLTSYDGVIAGSSEGPVVVPGDSHASEIRKALRNNRMPYGITPGVPAEGPNNENLLLAGWIDGGADEFASFSYDSDDDGTLDATGTYADDVRPILDTPNLYDAGLPACTSVGCHASTGSAAGLDLTTYAGIIAGAHDGTEPILVPGDSAASPLMRRLRKNRMPLTVSTSVPRDGPTGEVLVISAWIDAGAPEFDSFPLPGTDFVRGDGNRDGGVDIADAIATLEHLFTVPGLTCMDAADANDDGAVDISDAVYTLSFLFSGGPLPPAPYPLPGTDPTADALGCDS